MEFPKIMKKQIKLQYIPKTLALLFLISISFSSVSFTSEPVTNSDIQTQINNFVDEESRYLINKMSNLGKRVRLPSRKGVKFAQSLQPQLEHIANTDYLHYGDEKITMIEREINDFISKSKNEADVELALNFKGFIYFSIKEYGEAIRIYEKIIENPINKYRALGVIYGLSQLHFIEGDFPKAKTYLLVWLQLNSDWSSQGVFGRQSSTILEQQAKKIKDAYLLLSQIDEVLGN
tara:strand:+ start:243 stop:944 length:702 start_codon:yes stop_codon:yes gene_type:complete